MNYGEREHLLKSLNAGLRYDGRALEDLRNIEIETDVITTAEGSARVRMGKTEVIVGIKMQVGEPYSDSPDKGNLSLYSGKFNVHCSTCFLEKGIMSS